MPLPGQGRALRCSHASCATETRTRYRYAIAIGSNRSRSRLLSPVKLVALAIYRLSLPPFSAIAQSDIIASAPVGPSTRRYANAVIIVETSASPPELLAELQMIERQAGRRRARRWGARTLDLDILLWSGGRWRSRGLVIPHYAYHDRDFVLVPLEQIAPQWRDPITGLTVAQTLSQVKRPKPVDRSPSRH